MSPDRVRAYTVAAADGALLRVFDHPADPAAAQGPTVVLAHGWTLTHKSWQPVVDRVRAATGARIVLWDQRGHGGSTRGTAGFDVHALGDDLAEVLAVAAPDGPLVLAGHSMGGMTVMAYAGTHPDEVRHRVRGVAFVATSAGGLAGGRRSRTNQWAMQALSRAPGIRAGRFITENGQRALLFGEEPDPQSVRLTRDQVASTRLPVLGGYYGALMRHDEEEALAALAGIPTRILVGGHDRLTPTRHSARLADLLPDAELEILPGLGHMLTYEAPGAVADGLVELVAAAGGAGAVSD